MAPGWRQGNPAAKGPSQKMLRRARRAREAAERQQQAEEDDAERAAAVRRAGRSDGDEGKRVRFELAQNKVGRWVGLRC